MGWAGTHRRRRGMALLVAAVDDQAEAGAHEADNQRNPEGLQQPGRVDEVDHLRWIGAALRVEAGLLAAGFGWFGHDAWAASPASHA